MTVLTTAIAAAVLGLTAMALKNASKKLRKAEVAIKKNR